jgi:hypothetical protein
MSVSATLTPQVANAALTDTDIAAIKAALFAGSPPVVALPSGKTADEVVAIQIAKLPTGASNLTLRFA